MAKAEVSKEVWSQATWPNGVDIRYQEEPKRIYQVRGVGPKIHPAQSASEWREAISVTTALDCLNKPLAWWGMKTGIAGMVEGWKAGEIRPVEGQPHLLAVFNPDFNPPWEIADQETGAAYLNRKKMTVNHKRDDAGDRGKSVHDALEMWVTDRVMPVPAFYPEEERGYVEGLVKFLGDIGEVKSKPEAEIMVGSVEHCFAGRYDLEMVLHNANLVTKLPTPTWPGPRGKPEERTVFEGRTLLDLKTPKDVYASHHLQLAGYEGARLECGKPPTKQQIVVRVAPDGTYLAVASKAEYQDFLNVLATSRSIERIMSKKVAA